MCGLICVEMECCQVPSASGPHEVYYESYLCPHERYVFNTHPCMKTGRAPVLLHALLGFEAVSSWEIRHRLISRVSGYRDVWLFLVLVREILKQDEPHVPERRIATKRGITKGGVKTWTKKQP